VIDTALGCLWLPWNVVKFVAGVVALIVVPLLRPGDDD